MGQCNTGSKSTRRSFKTQGLSRPLIQAQGYFVQARLREARQIGFLGQVLSWDRRNPAVTLQQKVNDHMVLAEGAANGMQ